MATFENNPIEEVEGSKWPPLRVLGAAQNTAGSIIFSPGTEQEESLPSKIADRRHDPQIGPSTGWLRRPAERVTDEIRKDIADGYVTEESARLGYKHYPVTS